MQERPQNWVQSCHRQAVEYPVSILALPALPFSSQHRSSVPSMLIGQRSQRSLIRACACIQHVEVELRTGAARQGTPETWRRAGQVGWVKGIGGLKVVFEGRHWSWHRNSLVDQQE